MFLCSIGSFIRIFSYIGDSYWVMAIGQTIIGISVILLMMIYFKYLIFHTNQILKGWLISCCLVTVPFGFLISLFLA